MVKFKFIHAADLHLGSPFTGLGSLEHDQEIRDRIRDATFTAFDNLIQKCIKEEIDFLLLAGDIYNSNDKNLRAQFKFREGMRELAKYGIKVYVVHGNHDPLDKHLKVLEMPDNVHVFGGKSVERIVIDLNDIPAVSISGISYSTKKVEKNLSRLFWKDNTENASDDLFKIGVLHCSVDNPAGHEQYAPCSLKHDLKPSGYDYWALGHVHTRKILNEKDPCVVYPGNIQGLHINETGKRGCYLVNVNANSEIDLDFVPLDDIRWYNEEIRIDQLDTVKLLEKAIETSINGCTKISGERQSILKIRLTGRGKLHGDLKENQDTILENLRDISLGFLQPVIIDSIDIATSRKINRDDLVQSEGFIGDLLKYLDEVRSDEILRNELMGNLKDLYGNARAKKVLDDLDLEAILNIIDKAEHLSLDLLMAGDENED